MICVPIVSSTMANALSDIAAAQDYADVIKLRLDLISDYDLPELLKAVGKPCIVTNRSKVDGGQFKGSEEERVQSLREAIELGADYIDIETVTGEVIIERDGSGDIKIQDVQSNVEIGSDGSGGIKIRDIKGEVLIGSDGSGSVNIVNVSGSLMIIAKGSGDVHTHGIEGQISLPR